MFCKLSTLLAASALGVTAAVGVAAPSHAADPVRFGVEDVATAKDLRWAEELTWTTTHTAKGQGQSVLSSCQRIDFAGLKPLRMWTRTYESSEVTWGGSTAAGFRSKDAAAAAADKLVSGFNGCAKRVKKNNPDLVMTKTAGVRVVPLKGGRAYIYGFEAKDGETGATWGETTAIVVVNNRVAMVTVGLRKKWHAASPEALMEGEAVALRVAKRLR